MRSLIQKRTVLDYVRALRRVGLRVALVRRALVLAAVFAGFLRAADCLRAAGFLRAAVFFFAPRRAGFRVV